MGDLQGHKFHGNQWTEAKGAHVNYISQTGKGQLLADVRWYVGAGDEYSQANKKLRGRPALMRNYREGNGDRLLDRSVRLQEAIQGASPLPPGTKVYRGIAGTNSSLSALDAQMVPGAQVRLDGFQSTSLNPDIAKIFSESESGKSPRAVLFEIHDPVGLSLGDQSYAGQDEVLLPHGARYEVVGRETDGSVTTVKLRQLDHGIERPKTTISAEGVPQGWTKDEWDARTEKMRAARAAHERRRE